MQHSQKLKEMDRDFMTMQKERKQRVADESQQAKDRYMKYWKEKLAVIYTEQAQTILQVGRQKEDKKKELENLEEEEIKLLEEINKHHSQQVESKKEYMAALSLPVKDVAQAMGEPSPKDYQRRRNNSQHLELYDSSGKDRYEKPQEERLTIDRSGLRMPNANVNQAKLKVILQELKKLDRKSTYSSRAP